MREKFRLDKLLVLNNYAENVNKAKALIMSGNVFVNEIKIENQAQDYKNIEIRIKKSYILGFQEEVLS